MSAPTPPELPSFTNKTTFFALAQGLFVWLTTTFMQWVDATATAMNLNSTNDVSTSSVLIGTGSKSLTVSASKSYVGGMYVVISDNTTPGTTNSVNSMTGQITSYNSSTGALVVNVLKVLGSGTKTAWVVSQCAPPSLEVSTTMQAVTSQTTLAAAAVAMDVPVNADIKQLQSVAATVASNALTATLNPTKIDFRSTTLTTGAPNKRTVASAITLVVPSGATLGATAAVSARLVLLAIDNAGTVELGILNLAGGNNLDETGLISTVAISASSTAANVVYSTTARSGVPYRVIGFIDSSQSTAGVYASVPTLVQAVGGQAQSAMSGLAFGQVYQDLTASRVKTTNYTNTTGRPIFVYVTGLAGVAAAQFYFYVAGFEVGRSSTAEAASRVIVGGFIVPPGMTYSVADAAGTNSIFKWVELR
jgi:hypothetical protein